MSVLLLKQPNEKPWISQGSRPMFSLNLNRTRKLTVAAPHQGVSALAETPPHWLPKVVIIKLYITIFWLPLLMPLMTCLCPAMSNDLGLAPPLEANHRFSLWVNQLRIIAGLCMRFRGPLTRYSLRPRAHSFALPAKDDRNFIPRLLYGVLTQSN